jgi:pimeloyl-ACP methyl ester carboxylesterase
MAPFSFKIIRCIIAGLELASPALAGRLAFALFQRTPDPRRVSERERKLNAEAGPFMGEARRHCLVSSHGRFAAFEFGARGGRSAPSVLVIHGWGSRSEHMRPIIARLLAEGHRVVALDLPGHGASPGRRLNMATAVAAVGEACRWLGPFRAVVGHSFGGAVALNAACGSLRGMPPIDVANLVLISAPSSIPALFEEFGRFLGLGRRSQAALERRVEVIAGRSLREYVGARQLQRLGIPTLVVHAPDDREVGFAEAEAYASAGDHVSLFRAEGLGHRRILADHGVADRIAAFLAAGESTIRTISGAGTDRGDSNSPFTIA